MAVEDALAEDALLEESTSSGHLYTFPPFPKPLPGRELPPFESFEACGIIVNPAKDPKDKDAPEMDGLGIPTMRLKVKHTDVKKKSRKKKKSKVMSGEVDDTGKPLQWWEIWEQDEEARAPLDPYDETMDDAERLHHSATDFFSGRKWPAQESSIHAVWSQIKVFIGADIMGAGLSKNRFKRSDNAGGQGGTTADVVDEDDFDDEDEEWGVKPTQPTTIDEPAPVRESGIEEVADELSAEDIRTAAFLDNPVYSLRMFLSSFFIDRGMIWSETKSRDTPKLFAFFLNYIIRNKLLTSTSTLKKIKNALSICELAERELPATWAVGSIIPDIQVTAAFVDLWGKKLEVGNMWAQVETTTDADLISGDAELVDVEDMLKDSATREAIIDNVDGKVDDATVEAASGWGDGGAWAQSSWGNADSDGTTWGSAPPDLSGGTAWSKTTEAEPTTDPNINWSPTPSATLLSLMGPIDLPSTHRPGIVEQSTRRVKAILPPGAQSPDTKDPASSIEAKLRERFARIIFSSWNAGSDEYALRSDGKTDVNFPSVLPTSVGRVVPDVPGHDMEKDDIEVLMDAAHTDKFIQGMGFTGTWVQIARNEDEGGEQGRLWYMESVAQFLPSYYVNCLY